MKNKFLSLLIAGSLFALSAAPTFASGVNCQPIYGGGETCTGQGSLTINKMVQNPQTSGYVDNLTVNDPKYNPDQNINFQISVANPGTDKLSQVTVTDTFPTYVNFVSGPGAYNNSTRQLIFKVSDLKAGETRTFNVVGKVVGAASLPTSQVTTCAANNVGAAGSNGQATSDVSQFCIQVNVPPTTKGGLPIYPVPQKQFTTPATGPEMLPILGIIGSAISGVVLRKKSGGSK